MSRLPRGLAPLRHRGFRLLAAGQLTSNIGDGFYVVALPWYVLASHGGALLLGAVLTAYGIPRTVLVAVSGHASDRWHPWTVMMVADILRALAVGALVAVTLSGPASAVILIPAAAVIGVGEGLFLPASFSIVPSLVDDADLEAGNSLIGSSTQFATLVGPAVGGGLVAAVGPAGAFLVDAITFVISAITLAGVRAGPAQAPESSQPVGSSTHMTESEPSLADEAALTADDQVRTPAIRSFIRSERVLQIMLVITLAANLGSGGLGDVALPALAHGPFHAGAAGYGGLVASIGVGALIGTLAAGGIGRVRRPSVVASLAFLAEAAFMAVVPYLGSPVAGGVALAVFGGLNGFGNIIVVTTVQRWAPPEMLGRLMGLVLLASFGIFPVSVALAGIVVHDYGAALYFPAAAAILASAVLIGLTQRTWRSFGVSPTADPHLTLGNEPVTH